MTAYILVFGLSVVLGVLLTVLVRWAGRRLGILDLPDGFRKVQSRPIPRMGGVAIFGAFFGALIAVRCLYDSTPLIGCLAGVDFLPILCGGLAVLLIGLWDDVRGLPAGRKLLLLCVVAAAMYLAGYRIGKLSNPFGGAVDLGYWAVPVTLLWFLGCMNAMNFIDGLDGLASGVTVFAAGTVFLTSVLFHNSGAALFSLALTGAVIGFLAFNFHPASIFLGDSGSYLLGFLIACLGLRGSQKANMVVALLIPFIALGLPVVDTFLAIVRRWSRALPLSAGDRQHIHHRLLRAGLTHRQAVLMMYAACLGLAGCALLLTAARDAQAAGVLIMFGLATVVIVRVVGLDDLKMATRRVSAVFEQRKIRAECRTVGYEATERMAQTETVLSLWEIFTHAAQRMGLDRASLTVRTGAPPPSRRPDLLTFRWQYNGNGHEGDAATVLWSARFPLIVRGVALGRLEIIKATNGKPMARELPEMLNLIAASLAENIDRLSREPMAAERLRA